MRNAMKKTAMLMGLLTLLVGAAFAQTDTKPAQAPGAPEGYILGPEDVINVVTRDVTEASGDFLVRTDGKISFPLVGEVTVAGLTTAQLESKLEELLAKELRDPQVTVNIKQMRLNRIFVTGDVAQPGIQDYRPGWKLSQLIASCGGLRLPPERLKAIVMRPNEKMQVVQLRRIFIDGDDASDLAVKPGDTVSIASDVTLRINIIGPVGKPGVLTILEGQGAVEALAAAGGEAQGAALSKAKIVRGGKEIPVNLYEAVKNAKVEFNVPLEDNDTLLIPTTDARVAVMGQVKTVGAQPIPDGREWTLSQAISQAGGPAPGAKMDGLLILRKDESGKIQSIPMNYKGYQNKKDPSGDFVLQDRDVIFVPQSGKTESGQINAVLGLLFYPMRLLGIW